MADVWHNCILKRSAMVHLSMSLPRPAQSKTILVVDDDRRIVKLVPLYLQRDGLQVVQAFDGTTALEIARADPPALAILDLTPAEPREIIDHAADAVRAFGRATGTPAHGDRARSARRHDR